MLAFQSMIVSAATDAGMAVPPSELLDKTVDDGEETLAAWDRESFPHFWVFCQLQLGRSMARPGQHWDNAKVIAAIPLDQIKTMDLADFEAAGVEIY